MPDKKVPFSTAMVAFSLGFEIYGKSENELVTEWNPKNQNMVSWNAILNGEWYIKEKE